MTPEERRQAGVGLRMLASVIGVVLWLTSMPVTGEILMVIRALLVVADVLLGAVWSRGSGKAGIAC